jgi:hypothetical protein|tara:strand:- start:517 stop:969 length:453 start_codon:yes stop_codon:yes gene_type:complete
MAEIKITCPHCLNDNNCFEEKIDLEKFSSYICFNCGFMSNSTYTRDSDAVKKMEDSSTELMRDIKFFDYEREIFWFPTILNMGKFGMIYPEGTKNNWNWKLAEVRKLSKEEQKDPQYQGHEHTLDVENATEYGQHEFLDACKKMGIVKDL